MASQDFDSVNDQFTQSVNLEEERKRSLQQQVDPAQDFESVNRTVTENSEEIEELAKKQTEVSSEIDPLWGPTPEQEFPVKSQERLLFIDDIKAAQSEAVQALVLPGLQNTKTLADRFEEDLGVRDKPLSPLAGAVAGGILGAEKALPLARVAGPWAPLVVLTGSVLGAGVGEQGVESYNRTFAGYDDGRSPGQRVKDMVSTLVTDAELGMIFPVAGKYIAPHAKQALKKTIRASGQAASKVKDSVNKTRDSLTRTDFNEGAQVSTQQVAEESRELGVTLTAGTLGPRNVQGIEKWLLNFPTSANMMWQTLKRVSNELDENLGKVVGKLGTVTDREVAGTRIQEAVTYKWLPKQRKMQEKVYSDIGKALPKENMIPMKNFMGMVDDELQELRYLVKSKNTIIAKEAKKLGEDIRKTVVEISDKKLKAGFRKGGFPNVNASGKEIVTLKPSGSMNFGAIRKFRTRLNEMIGEFTMDSSQSKSALTRMRFSINEDMEAYLATQSKDVQDLWAKGVSMSKDFHTQKRLIAHEVDKRSPNKLLGTFEASTVDKKVMKGLKKVVEDVDPDAWGDAAATIVADWGQATAKNSRGSEVTFFSAEGLRGHFNTAKLSGALDIMLEGTEKGTKEHLDKVIRLAGANLEGNSLLNTSMTASHNVIAQIMQMGFVGSAITGNVPAMATSAAGLAGPYVLAKAMLRKPFLQYLEKGMAIKASNPGAINKYFELGKKVVAKNPELREPMKILFREIMVKQEEAHPPPPTEGGF